MPLIASTVLFSFYKYHRKQHSNHHYQHHNNHNSRASSFFILNSPTSGAMIEISSMCHVTSSFALGLTLLYCSFSINPLLDPCFAITANNMYMYRSLPIHAAISTSTHSSSITRPDEE